MRNKLLLLILSLHCFVSSLSADVRNYDSFKILEGLPHSDVNAIVQDSTGYMWFATYGGLCKYDGYRLQVYRRDNSGLSRDRVLSLHVASDSCLYIGTESGGLNIYDPRTDKITHVGKYHDRSNVTDDVVNYIFEDEDGAVWVCHNNVLSEVCMDSSGERFLATRYKTESMDMYVDTGVALNRDTILFSSGDRLMMYRKSTGKSMHLMQFDVVRCFVKRDADVLVGTYDGLYGVDRNGEVRELIPDLPMRHLTVDRNGHIWIGTFEEGLKEYTSDFMLYRHYCTNPLVSGSISSNEISAVYEDNSGVIWAGTIGGGLNMLSTYGNNIHRYSMINGLSSNRVITFIEDCKKNLWVSTHDGGVDVFDPQSGTFRNLYINGVPSRDFYKVSAMYNGSDGHMLVGTWDHGVWRISRDGIKETKNGVYAQAEKFGRHEITGCSIYKITDDRDGNIWISTNRGLWEYVVGTSEWRVYRHDNMNLSSLYSDFLTDILPDPDTRDKTIWIGTRAGLNKLVFSREGLPTMHRVTIPDSIGSAGSSIFVSDLHRDRQGRLWVSTLGDGLYCMLSGRNENEIPAFQNFNTTNVGFHNNELESILEDDNGNLWIGGYGISKFDPESISVTLYTERDNLQSNYFKIWAAYRMSDGKMAFGGTNGFNIFDPANIGARRISPKTVVSSIYVRNEKLTPSDTSSIVLSHDQNSLIFEFTAFNYSNPALCTYKYRLEGYEDGWNTISGTDPRCVYSNLSKGRYCLEVYELEAESLSGAAITRIPFVVKPHFMNSLVAYLIYTLLVIVLMYIIYQLSQRQIREKNERKVEQDKLRFFTDMAHEIKTPLSLISAPVQELLQSAVIGTSTRNRLEVINKGIVTLQSVVGQILDLRKYEEKMMKLSVSEVDICRFLNETAELFSPLAHNTQVNFKRTISETPLMVYIDKPKMERVIVNLLSNAFKFTQEGGTVCLSCWSEGRYVMISVEDNGTGIGDKDIPHIFDRFYQAENQSTARSSGTGIGLSLSKYIVNHHNAEIDVESKLNFGTKFTIKLLKGKSHFTADQIDVSYRNSDDLSNYEPLESFKNVSVSSTAKEATVLVVDDNDQLRHYLYELLSTKYNVLVAENGMRAYEIAIAEQPDLILSDIVMPQMTGMEMCKRIKNNEATSHISVVLLTARDLVSTEIDSWKTGADGFISKPFNVEVLMSRIGNLISSKDKMRKAFKATIDVNPSEITIVTADERFLKKCLKAIEENISNPDFGVEELSAAVGVSKAQLYRKISSITGQSSVQFIRSIRLKRAAQLLLQDDSSVSDIMYMVGFNSQSYFSKIFKEEFGCMPREYTGNKNKSV